MLGQQPCTTTTTHLFPEELNGTGGSLKSLGGGLTGMTDTARTKKGRTTAAPHQVSTGLRFEVTGTTSGWHQPARPVPVKAIFLRQSSNCSRALPYHIFHWASFAPCKNQRRPCNKSDSPSESNKKQRHDRHTS